MTVVGVLDQVVALAAGMLADQLEVLRTVGAHPSMIPTVLGVQVLGLTRTIQLLPLVPLGTVVVGRPLEAPNSVRCT